MCRWIFAFISAATHAFDLCGLKPKGSDEERLAKPAPINM